MNAPTPTVRKVVAEYDGRGWLVMDDAGDITGHPTAEAVIREVRRADAKMAKRDPHAFLATVVEWRNVPDGFEVPA